MARTQTSLLLGLLKSSVLFSFVLACGDSTTDPPTSETGSIQVSAVTTGPDRDSDGYTATVGSTNQSVGINGSTTFTGIATGSHTVTLSDFASNCAVSGTNPETVTVEANQTVSVSFAVTCQETTTIDEAITSLEDALFTAINALDGGTVGNLDQFSFAEARDLFQQVLDANPNDETAAFGLAITTIFVMEDNTSLRALADEWDTWLLTHSLDELSGVDLLGAVDPVFWPRASLPLDIRGRAMGRLTDFHQMRRLLIPREAEFTDFYPPTLAEHQALLRDVIAPALVTALDALNTVDTPDFVFVITERMQGETAAEADPLELDLTEILALRAAFETSLALIDAALAYVAEPSPWGAAGFAAAFETGSTFGTLASDGAALLLDTQERLLRAVGLLEQGLDNLVAETDDQSNDIIKYDPTGFGGFNENDGLNSQDVQDARDFLADAAASLQGPRTITEDFGNGEVTIVVDASKFFTDPSQDLKTILPDYMVMSGKFRWSALLMEEWTFPDPTFNGILPEIASNTELLEALDLRDLYYEHAFPQGDWMDLAPLPDGRILAFAGAGFLGVVSADLTSVVIGPTIDQLEYTGTAIAVRTSAPEIIAIDFEGLVFARPNDDASPWIQQAVVLPPDMPFGFVWGWTGLAVTPAGVFAMSQGGAVARIEPDLMSSSPLARIETAACPGCFSFAAMASNGALLVALSQAGELFSTSDPSVGWTLGTMQLSGSTGSWEALTSGPANTNFAATNYGEVYQVSADFSTSTQLPSVPMPRGCCLVGLTTNDDGSTLVAITYNGILYSRPTADPTAAWTEHLRIPRIMTFDKAPSLGGASR